jgi:hypothetical protein
LKVQKGEITTGWHVRNGLQSLIDSRHPCKVKIPHTPFCGDAWVAKIHPTEDFDCLFIDGVGGFEQALPPSQDRKITLKYSEEIPLAAVRRVEPPAQNGRNLYALEFIGLGETVKKRFRQPISETQRLLPRKCRKGPLLMESEETSKA